MASSTTATDSRIGASSACPLVCQRSARQTTGPTPAAVTSTQVSFTASPTSGRLPLKVAFSDASTGSITAWAWDFGDGTSSTLPSPSHIYASAGTYTVQLSVTGPDGSTTAIKTGYI